MRFEIKGNLLFEITKLGLVTPLRGDEIMRFWPWSNPMVATKFHSKNYFRYFNSFEEYWMHVGTVRESDSLKVNKVNGYDFDEILTDWARSKLTFGFSVVLYDINVQEKSTNFWVTLPNQKRQELLKDVVVLRCADLKEVKRICDSIDPSFAKYLGVYAGEVVQRKLENDE